jgi:tetratricopeptide (TPR) repeat protein
MRSNENARFRLRRLRARYGPVIAILLAAAACLLPAMTATQTERLTRRAARALYFRDFPKAAQFAGAALKRSPDSPQALLIAGQAAAGVHEDVRAIEYFERVTDADTDAFVRAQFGMGERLLLLGQMAAAERHLQRARELNPRHLGVNQRLSYLLRVQGRAWEAIAPTRELIRRGRFRGDELESLGLVDVMFVSEPRYIKLCLAAVPDDPLPLLAQARVAFLKNQYKTSKKMLQKIVFTHRDQIAAQATLGRILLTAGRDVEFLQWNNQLTSAADRHPEIWFARGLWAQRYGQKNAAIRCYLETLRRFPNHTSAMYKLSQLLTENGQNTLADRFAIRADLLRRLEREYLILGESGVEAEHMEKAAFLLAEMGRYWEAAAICDLAIRLFPDRLLWAESGVKRFARLADNRESFVAVSAIPTRNIDVLKFPLPDFSREMLQNSNVREPADSSTTASFIDMAQQAGLDFTFFNGSKTPKGLEHIFETTGGGVAVLDFDGDLWPDLYLAQGSKLPPDTQDHGYTDRLFRNLGSGRFEDVTVEAGLGDYLFSQGATAGDFNCDGFPDLYVANIGANRLYLNNGDGTFTDVTRPTGTGAPEWTLSCLLADLNGDGYPDIYAVNYLVTEEVKDRSCKRNGQPLTCAPTLFSADQDRLFLNTRDGGFEEVTNQSGIVYPDGKGLGILAADFDGSRRLSLFVGNDTTPNFFFVNQTTQRGGQPAFIEQGRSSGLSVSGDGREQATMGIAAGDFNNDGRFDLFTTNFFGDANTLYAQQPGSRFSDETRRAQLWDSGFDLLGFGTQALDAELDGFPDLLVTNGHVDRTFATGEPDEMPPQFLHNLGNGRFVELPAATLGPFFQKKYLGRSMARLDWNRDGREDVCISHLYSPVALLTNQTKQVGNFLAIHLRGVESERDSTGTVVRVHTDGKSWTRQLMAGDGYMCSNQKLLVFGLGDTATIDRLVVQWPSGVDQSFSGLQVNREIVLIEGRSKHLILPRPR